jgi:hypothetical protein
MKRRKGFSPKRRIRQKVDPRYLETLAQTITYGGNPEHKRNPGDFGLTPPSHPRPDKTLCDKVKVFHRGAATDLLRAGCTKGLISEQQRGAFPQNIWAVSDGGFPLEAQLENVEQGTYHGYPMADSDPFGEMVLKYWSQR